MPADASLLDVLLNSAHGPATLGNRSTRLTYQRTLPARAGIPAPWPDWADSAVVAGYQSLGIARPWTHQVAAANALWAGQTVALATGTGSGKSLRFWLPALSAVDRERPPQARSRVLYLSPTKALAADQLANLQRLASAMPPQNTITFATCDGDTAPEERRWIRDCADVVLTNPDFLHYSLLPGHRRWAGFLRSLRYVVVDEGHAYRGVFGAHVSLILRRLGRLVQEHRSLGAACSRTGGSPLTYVVASATAADPADTARRLTGANAVLAITQDTAPSGERMIALWQPPPIPSFGAALTSQEPSALDAAVWDVDPFEHEDPFAAGPTLDSGDSRQLAAGVRPSDLRDQARVLTSAGGGDSPRRSATSEAADLLADLVGYGARTLAFTRSRRGAETVASLTRTILAARDPQLPTRVAAYRGGYLPEERRALEQALRSGDLLGLASTNALELGVDISGLDAVLIAGWPGTLMSLWQQAGRAGRAGADGLVVFIAREDPLDSYLVTHPEAIFDAPLEATVFDPTNRYVLAGQLCAAAAERPLRQEELSRFGDPNQVERLLVELVAAGALRRRPSGWYWTHPEPAARLSDLRGSGGAPVRIVESATGRLLGTVDGSTADAQVHGGAVYVHQGETYLIEHLDLTDHVAFAQRREVEHRTWSREVSSLTILEDSTPQRASWGPITWGFGEVETTSQVISFERRRVPDLQVLGTEALELPERSMRTKATWYSVPDPVWQGAGISPDALPGALHAAEHAAIGMLPLLATCDRWDLGGLSSELHPDTGTATVFVFDAFPGGAGFAERGFSLANAWMQATRDVVAACPCDLGCPRCIQSPKCGNFNSPLDKANAVRLLDAILAARDSETTDI